MNPVEPHRALGFLEGFYIGLLQNFDWPPAIPLTFIYSPQGFCKGCVEAADRVEGLLRPLSGFCVESFGSFGAFWGRSGFQECEGFRVP